MYSAPKITVLPTSCEINWRANSGKTKKHTGASVFCSTKQLVGPVLRMQYEEMKRGSIVTCSMHKNTGHSYNLLTDSTN